MKAVLQTVPLANQWPCIDPFLFCAYHLDRYPEANGKMGPKASLEGRNMGADFANVNGWNMYHGDSVPGFPQHPHRGFETVTIAREGVVDHYDSLGAVARFAEGDAQWITAGRGLSHSEMFPLLKDNEKNTHDLFQIWLNLPRSKKLSDPHFAMFWSEKIPRVQENGAEITLIAGSYSGTKALPPPPNSYAADPTSDVAIWTLKLQPGSKFTLPATLSTSARTIYFFAGVNLKVDGETLNVLHAALLKSDVDVVLENTANEVAEVLMLQGRPLDEPVAQYGPFVMNTEQEIREAMQEYQRTQFGGWPWPSDAPVLEKSQTRFAKFPDGHTEEP